LNINNLQEGQVIKNYKELCGILEIKATTNGITKNKQMEELKLYCNYEKQGNKYIIKEIYETPIDPVLTIDDLLKTKNNKYIKLLANIIVEYLYNNPDEVKEVPISRLFVMLGITNTNYNSANYYRKELSQLYDIRLASIYYFYSNTRMEFKNIIERCLNNLKSRRVLNWYKVVMIKDENTKQIYKADKETEKFIIDTEKETLQYLKLNNMYELMKDRKKLREFNKIIYKETNINYFYAYDLVIGEKALKIEYNNIQEYKENLNKLIIDRTKNIFNKDKYTPFENDYKLLNDILINFANKEVILSDLQNKHTNNIKDYNSSREVLNEKYRHEQEELKSIFFDTYAIDK
jgi:hypothetical protein